MCSQRVKHPAKQPSEIPVPLSDDPKGLLTPSQFGDVFHGSQGSLPTGHITPLSKQTPKMKPVDPPGFFTTYAEDPTDCFYVQYRYDDPRTQVPAAWHGCVMQQQDVTVKDYKGREKIPRYEILCVQIDGAFLDDVGTKNPFPPLLPHIMNETSPGNHHCFYLLKPLKTRKEFEYYKGLISETHKRGLNDTVVGVNRLFKWPGCVHLTKHSFITRTVYAHPDVLKVVANGGDRRQLHHLEISVYEWARELGIDPDSVTPIPLAVPGQRSAATRKEGGTSQAFLTQDDIDLSETFDPLFECLLNNEMVLSGGLYDDEEESLDAGFYVIKCSMWMLHDADRPAELKRTIAGYRPAYRLRHQGAAHCFHTHWQDAENPTGDHTLDDLIAWANANGADIRSAPGVDALNQLTQEHGALIGVQKYIHMAHASNWLDVTWHAAGRLEALHIDVIGAITIVTVALLQVVPEAPPDVIREKVEETYEEAQQYRENREAEEHAEMEELRRQFQKAVKGEHK